MKALFILIVLCFSQLAIAANFYTEIDLSFPALNITGSTNKEVLDFRGGFISKNFDISYRYRNSSNFSLSGDEWNINNNESKIIQNSIRLGYLVTNSWQIGVGVGRFNINYELTSGTETISGQASESFGEAFLSYTSRFSSGIYLKLELNGFSGRRININESSNIPNYSFKSNHKVADVLALILLGYDF